MIKIKNIKVEIKKLVTMAEMGLGAVRPLNKEKRTWINKLKKDGVWDPILVTPIKDSGYYLLTDGWHRVQAATALKRKTMNALQLPANAGLSMAKANKILRDIDREYKFKLDCSNIIGHWAMMQTLLED
jgi:ParB-like chromosome segregation protein Spo0J